MTDLKYSKGTKETMYLVKDIFLDTSMGGEREIDAEEVSDVTQDIIGLWYARDINHLCDKIAEQFGFPVIDIDATTNTLHSLTSYL
tara:strand:- start:5 stop:262 length:258 start_codon:yes stop_codon:yes gene_type:complete